MNFEERQQRLDRARFAIRAELLIGLQVTLLTGFQFVTAVGDFFYVPLAIRMLILAAPVVSLLAWVWMLRLSRPDPEVGETSWRYRD